ncbi:MAG: hypothetical protein KDK66_03795 [Deltaproteobacteria bacterium]|nr:hypothetical protein [Deltaproteobacteria bacterium]
MKKKLKTTLTLSLLGSFMLFPWIAQSHPFKSSHLCLSPDYRADRGPLKIRDDGACASEDIWMEIQEKKEDQRQVILLLPAKPPLSEEEKKDWENFKKYYQGD